MGVGIEHLFTVQEILRLKDILFHMTYDTDTGILYRISLELLLLEVGVSSRISMLDYDQLSILASPSLVKSTWKFLSEYQIHLEHDLQISSPRVNDQPIMAVIPLHKPSQQELVSVNRCRLFLHAFFISDISDGFGTHILEDAWLGRNIPSSHDATWPCQGPPTRRDWKTWQKFLRLAVLSRGRRLKTPLVSWLTFSDASWFIDPSLDQLYRKTGNNWSIPKITSQIRTAIILLDRHRLSTAYISSPGKNLYKE